MERLLLSKLTEKNLNTITPAKRLKYLPMHTIAGRLMIYWFGVKAHSNRIVKAIYLRG